MKKEKGNSFTPKNNGMIFMIGMNLNYDVTTEDINKNVCRKQSYEVFIVTKHALVDEMPVYIFNTSTTSKLKQFFVPLGKANEIYSMILQVSITCILMNRTISTKEAQAKFLDSLKLCTKMSSPEQKFNLTSFIDQKH